MKDGYLPLPAAIVAEELEEARVARLRARGGAGGASPRARRALEEPEHHGHSQHRRSRADGGRLQADRPPQARRPRRQGVITLGGIVIILSVLGILVFIGAEALPLFRGATGERLGDALAGRRPGEATPHADAARRRRRRVPEVPLRGHARRARRRLPRSRTARRTARSPIPGLEGAARHVRLAQPRRATRSRPAPRDGRVALVAGALPARVRGAGPEGPRRSSCATAGRHRGRPREAAGSRGRLRRSPPRARSSSRPSSATTRSCSRAWREAAEGEPRPSRRSRRCARSDGEQVTHVRLGRGRALVAGTERRPALPLGHRRGRARLTDVTR